MSSARRMVMEERLRAGKTFAEVGEFFGISRQAVQQEVTYVPRSAPPSLPQRAYATLEYMRREAPKRGGYMFEGTRPAYEAGTYHDDEIAELLSRKLIAPHPDPTKGWIVVQD